MKGKRILILGGGIMQVPAINLAKGMGLSVIVADGNPEVPGRKIADVFAHVDLKDHQKMIKTALHYQSDGGLDGVFTAGTDFSVTVARVAEAAGLPGIPVETAINASDKYRMRTVLNSAGISGPSFMRIDLADHIPECTDDGIDSVLKFPLVVKPVDNMGSRGISKVRNCAEFQKNVLSAGAYSGKNQVIIEEYLEGPEYSLDALVYDGEITICGIADRHIFFPPYFVEMGHTIPSNGEPEVLDQVTAIFKKGIRALGITEGAAKGDIKWSHGKAFVGEIAARLSGGYMSGWTFPYSTGVEVTRSAIRISLGLPPEDLTPVFEKTTAERAFISIPGTVTEISGREEPFKIPEVKHLFFRITSGDNVSFPVNNVEKCGNCIAVSESREKAVYAAEKGCRSIFIRLDPESGVTEKFLFGEKQPWIPDAFSLTLQNNVAAVESMSGPEINGNEILVPELPNLSGERAVDWQGKTITEAFEEVVAITQCRTYFAGDHPEGLLTGKAFYRAFLRGGVQGGVWIIDFLREAVKNGKNIVELVSQWHY